MLRAVLHKMVAAGALPTPRPVTAAPPGKDLLEWWDSVSSRIVPSLLTVATGLRRLERQAKLSSPALQTEKTIALS
eukprot:COSAG02_NODE_5210_length_4540_cov_2.660662_5_plen_76_part_00